MDFISFNMFILTILPLLPDVADHRLDTLYAILYGGYCIIILIMTKVLFELLIILLPEKL